MPLISSIRTLPSRWRWRLATVVLALGTGDPARAAAPAESPAGDEGVLAHASQVLSWFRETRAADEWAVQPADEYYKTTQRDLARRAVAGEFDFARAMVAVLADDQPAPAKPNGDAARQARLSSRIAANTTRLVELHDRQEELQRTQANAAAADRPVLEARAQTIQAEIDLAQAQGETLEKALSLFSSDGAGDANSLESHLAALQRTAPEAFGAKTPAAAKPPAPATAPAGGILNRASALFTLVRNERALDSLAKHTHELSAETEKLAEPLTAQLRLAIQHADEVARDEDDAKADLTQLAAARGKIGRLTQRFRHLAAAAIPVREVIQLLQQSQNNLADWRHSVRGQIDGILRYLLIHAAALGVALLALVVFSELWRRATFKYVREPRRRRQFLVIRRFVTTTLMIVVVVTAVVSDFSSLATFAGFLTAGVAVALQTIILSVAAYFFLIGRYGVRVGDRVTVSGVTGDVVDIGLVRVFLMELAGTGVDLHPTGRVIVLANSALFSAIPVYKQLPGTDYAWHELFATIPPEADSAPVEQLLLQAVTGVYSGYRETIEQQHGVLQRLVDFRTEIPAPSAHLRLTEAAIEVVVRYPAELRRMSEIDEQVSRAVLAALRTAGGELRKGLASLPRIRAAVKS